MNLPTTRTPSNRASQCFLTLFLVLLFSGAVHAATTWYVDAGRPDDSGDGSSWDTAKKSIQAAVIAAAEGDLVLVADGDYAPFIAGAAAITISSVNGAGQAVIDGGDTTCCAVLGTDLVPSDTVLDGFTLKNGHAEKGGGAAYGILTNCRLIDNAAEYGGGAYGCTLTNCILENNVAEHNGGGANQCTLEQCTLTKNEAKRPEEDEFFGRGGGAYECVLEHCTLTENSADIGGGACQSNLSHCTLTKNEAKGYKVHDISHLGMGGGAVHSILTNCTIAENKAVSGGGAFNCTMTACALTDNEAYDGGGAFSCRLGICTLTNNSTSENGGGAYDSNLTNCLIAGNDAAKGGGGTYGGILINCTVTGNSAHIGGGGVTSRSTLKNSIVWANSAPTDANYSNCVFSFSCSEPLPDGEGNISANPAFIDANNGDYRLRASSPCLNKGINADDIGDTDLVGAPRIRHEIVDMGAYEISIFTDLAISPDTGVLGDFVTRLDVGQDLTLSGILSEAQLTLAVADGETILAQTTCAGDDQAFALVFPLPEGVHDLTIIVTDEDGNSSATAQTIVIDNTPPTAADLAMTPDTGALEDFITQLADGENLTLSGAMHETLLTVTVAEGENVLGQKVCEGDDQAFSFTFPLAEGSHDLTITITDQTGNSNVVVQAVVIDNTPPQLAMNLAIAPDTGVLGDFITHLADGENLTISDILQEALLSVMVAKGETVLGQKIYDGDDNLAFDLSFPLTEGIHDLTITVTDRAGNNNAAEQTVVIDNTPPPAAANLAIAPDTGTLDDFITQLADGENLTLSGILQEALLTVTIAKDENVLAQKICVGDDQAFALAFPLAEGTYLLTITVADVAGNSSVVEQTVVIDNTPPTADLAIAPDTGTPGDFITHLADGEKLTLSGALHETLLTVTVAKGETVLGQKICAGDDQGFAFSFPLAEGTHNLAITIADQASNSNVIEQTVVIDNTPPATAAANLAIAPDTGALGDFITRLDMGQDLTISGTLPEALLTVTVAEGETVLAQKICGDDQAFDLAFPLAEGTHDLAITVADQAGNSVADQLTVIIDNTPPAAAANLAIAPDTGALGDFITQLADGEKLTLSGTLQEALLTVAVAKGEIVLGQKICVGDDHAFAFAFPLIEGTHELTITITDQADNSSVAVQTIVIDNTPPAAATNLAIAPDTGVPGDFITHLADGEKLTLSGNLPEALLTVTVAEGENVLAQKICDGDTQAFDLAFPLAEGAHELTIAVTDQAGNSVAAQLTVVIDNTPPAAAANLAIAPDTGVPGDFITHLADGEKLTFSGTLPEKLLTVTVAEGENVLGQKICDGDDQAFALAFPLAEGDHELTITITDLAGNSIESQRTVIIDNTALDYNWQNGWNTLYLPFESIIPETEAALAALPRFSLLLASNSYIMATTPLKTEMWVFCHDRTKAPALRGNRIDEDPPDLNKLPPNKWSFIGFGSQNDMDLPDGTLAWEWQAGKYVLAQTMRPGHVYYIYREP
ncbi:MAG: PKD domain protein [Lentisphaerae bacterium ADurb.Bin082]|nr:MAG: PKD domain protein [Lentisphaerae bacterium ADurb.Bin082]HQL87834.1 Ig-like domain-containing protein [Lentisphaeria bacterium]